MTTAISGISSSATSFDPAKGAARFAGKVFADMDTDKDGKVKKEEFVSGLESKGVSADDAAKQFDAIDKQKTGSITKDDLETAMKSGTFAPPRPQEGAAGAQGGGRPQGAGGGGGASAAGGATKTYEAADTNQDGTVSQQEELVYSISHPWSESTGDASKIGTNINEVA
ncbi:Ca2+-binding EF-hand superfamily protein [Duganella sp. 1411]|uniref:EF-hand domain-containing protein n=1 Tax=Duganella sp. 1411 TaxID=2806572 RepID=UPI001AE86836|nr:EF-hand domain-containing protein [Duganella sp. 1411]MBP1208279.1 Ca2+-binding EF-hand superfamily protein [Duganella sp. 1411]